MSVRNYIEFYRARLDYHKYEKQINRFINKIVHLFTSVYKGITNYRVRETFWDLVDNRIKYNKISWYHVFASYMGKLITYEILFEKKIINEYHLDVSKDFFLYLGNLIIPFEAKIPNKFFIELINNIPVPYYDSILELYEEGIVLFGENLKKIIFNPDINPYIKIIKYKENFSNLFSVFLGKCFYMDLELARHGEKAHHNSLYEIFQLNNSNERTPPKNLNNVLILLSHIRNAISHPDKGGIIYDKENRIIVKDFKTDGTLSFTGIFSFEELYDIYYLLLILILDFESIALMLTLHRNIRELNFKYNKRFICPFCGYEGVVFAHPGRNNIVCDKCKNRLFINKKSEA